MYTRLYNAWQKERLNSKELQALEPSFYREISQYIKKINDELRMLDEKTLKYRLLRIELQKAQQLTELIMEKRFQKIITLILENQIISQSHLLNEEAEIFKDTLQVLGQYEKLKKNILEGRSIEPAVKQKQEYEKTLVRFTAKIPAIVGADMKTYGPFDPEDIATLPRENADTLVRQKAAVKIMLEP